MFKVRLPGAKEGAAVPSFVLGLSIQISWLIRVHRASRSGGWAHSLAPSAHQTLQIVVFNEIHGTRFLENNEMLMLAFYVFRVVWVFFFFN